MRILYGGGISEDCSSICIRASKLACSIAREELNPWSAYLHDKEESSRRFFA